MCDPKLTQVRDVLLKMFPPASFTGTADVPSIKLYLASGELVLVLRDLGCTYTHHQRILVITVFGQHVLKRLRRP
jgi:hypothetical protein